MFNMGLRQRIDAFLKRLDFETRLLGSFQLAEEWKPARGVLQTFVILNESSLEDFN